MIPSPGLAAGARRGWFASRKQHQPLDRVHLIEVEYQVSLLRAEVDWLRAVIADIRDGRLSWRALARDGHLGQGGAGTGA